ncbi:MAG: AMP-binding protein, partial [Clostridia bacterium]|nr:AMP-binding protein [Clostridia bacterium]
MANQNSTGQLFDIALRIKDMREIIGYSTATMAEKVDVPEDLYIEYETGNTDLPFTFMHKCAMAFGVEITDLMEGSSTRLSSYTLTRKGMGPVTAEEDGVVIQNMAALFGKKLATPYYCTYTYDPNLIDKPIHTVTHAGQEFDIVLKGSLKVQVGDHVEVLNEGDSIYYNSSTPHGMIAVGGVDCTFVAMIMATNEKEQRTKLTSSQLVPVLPSDEPLCVDKFIKAEHNENGTMKSLEFPNAEKFNFGFDTVDAIAQKDPEKLAMVHIANDKTERKFTFKDISEESARTANYFASLGIKKGDRVMLVLKRHYQFWFSMVALHKIGAVAIPATNQLMEHDFEYRFKAAGVKAIVCTADGITSEQVELAEKAAGMNIIKIMANGVKDGWHDFDNEYTYFRKTYKRTEDTPCGDDPMVMFFTSGTTGEPKSAVHSYKYALGHYVTARYWHMVEREGLHFTISETGWGKALWGKLYGQWLCEGAVFVYDFDRFHAEDILPMFKKYNITTFCAPPTMYRMFIKEDLSKYDLSSIKHATTAGEALNPEVFYQFQKLTGLTIHEGFGQTETTLSIGNLLGNEIRPGSMGKPIPGYGVDIL